MKKMLLLGLAFCLVDTLAAQTKNADTARLSAEKKELAAFLENADKKLADRQQAYLAAQQAKAHYDTIGLWQYRYEMKLLKEERKQLELVFIKQHPGYLVSLDALKDAIGPIPDDITKYEKIFKGLKKPIQQSEEGIKTKKLIDRYMTVRLGAQAPDFQAPDTSGNPVRLADYRGKYVLIDFWASWCGPCREENPIVVEAYNKYKNKNFDILSVSLDQPGKKADWIKAIQKDGLVWRHVSDLKYWDSDVARLYMIRSIPQNFLLDPDGKIIAKDLRGQDLSRKLEEILK